MKESKCRSFTKRLDILGHILTPEGLSAEPLKVQKIFEFPDRKDERQLQAFIGIVNYLSKFLPNLASTAAILTDVQGTTRNRRWTEAHVATLNHCKELINNRQVMKPCDNTSEEPKYLICNGSDIRSGSWLGQGTLDRIRPARFHCHKFNPTQLSYPTLQKELLAIAAYIPSPFLS